MSEHQKTPRDDAIGIISNLYLVVDKQALYIYKKKKKKKYQEP
jgi:hypothetical protein